MIYSSRLIITILSLLILPSILSADEYVNFIVEDSGQARGENNGNSTYFYTTNAWDVVTLDKNESLQITSYLIPNRSVSDFNLVDGTGNYTWEDYNIRYLLQLNDNGIVWQTVTLETDQIINGPGVVSLMWLYTIRPTYGSGDVTDLSYVTSNYDFRAKLRYRLISNKAETKFSVALDNDGNRVAMGYKESGSNAVIRVYEFNGSNWNQLGGDIE